MPDPEMGPDRLVPKHLPVARRGYDRDAVERLLHEAREAWTALEASHRRLLAEIEHAGGLEYLARDLGVVAGDMGHLLAGAQETARGIRERARADAAERLTAAVEEARRLVSEAEGQAFHVRADAWAAAESLLRQAEQTHRRLVAEADAEVLLIRAEAEQEAYRMVAASRREAQEITRGARFEAERTVLEIRAQPERILPVDPVPVEPATPPPGPATGRARRRRGPAEVPMSREEAIRVIQPPEARRPVTGGVDPASYGDALAAEVEALRVSAEVPVVPPVAVVPSAPVVAPAPGPAGEEAAIGPGALASEVQWEEAAPVEALPGEPAEAEAEASGDEAGPPQAQEPGAEPELAAPAPPVEPGGEVVGGAPRSRVPKVGEGAAVGDPVQSLFSRLRRAVVPEPESPEPKRAMPAPSREPAAPSAGPIRPDPLELRERLLLPVQNRALRRVKEAIVELQNLALDALRVSGAWEGEAAATTALLAALDPVAEEGAEAGAAAVAVFHGGEAPAPVISSRSTGLARAMAFDLAAQVRGAIDDGSGAGPLEVSAAAARVFRAWRSDEAERWVRAVAYASYHDSVLAGLALAGVPRVVAVASGMLCPECPARSGEAWDPADSLPRGTSRPPAHPDCVCTVAPA